MSNKRVVQRQPPLRGSELPDVIQQWLLAAQTLLPSIVFDTTAGSEVFALPSAGLNNSQTGQTNQNQEIVIIKGSADANTVTITGAISGPVTLSHLYDVARFKSDATHWWVAGIGGSIAPSPPTTPAGLNGDIQYNDAGAFGGETLVPLAHGGTAADLSASGGATLILAQDAAHIISARSLIAADIPGLDAAKIISGLLALARGGTGVDLSASGGATLVLAQDAAHVISARALIAADIPNLDASKITSGLLALARGGTGVDLSAAGSATAFLAEDAGHVITARSIIAADVPNLDASKITTGLLALARGGTGVDLSASGGATQLLAQDAGHVISARALVGADLPNPSASTLGGVESLASVASKWINQISTAGVPSATQPAFTDISGIATWPQMPLSNASGGIAFGAAVAGAKVTTGTVSAVTSLTINRGDCVVVVVSDSTALSNFLIRDNGGNPYSMELASVFATNTGITSIYMCMNARNAATSFTVFCLPNNFVGHSFSFCAATYSGVKSVLGATPVTATQLATNSGQITLTPTVANSFMVAGFGYFANTADVSAGVGTNLRTHQASTASIRGVAIADTTQAGLGAETCSVTGTSTPIWANVAIELVPN